MLEHNAAGRSPFLLTCDHYGRLIPRALGDLGAARKRADAAHRLGYRHCRRRRALSEHLDAHLIAQRYSRLVIDCNRPPRRRQARSRASAKPPPSPAMKVWRARRPRRGAERSSIPIIAASPRCIDRRLREGMPTVLVSLHSFTPVYAGIARPWHIGTLYHRDTRLPPLLLKAVARAKPISWSATTNPMRSATRPTTPFRCTARCAGLHEHRDRDPPGPDRRPGRREAMGRPAGADSWRDRDERCARSGCCSRSNAPASARARRRRRS